MKLLLAASAPVSAIEKKGNVDSIEQIHNPNSMFEEIHLLEPYSETRGRDRLGENIVVHHTYVPVDGGFLGKVLKGLALFAAALQGIKLVREHDIDVIRGQKPFIGGFVGLLVQWFTGVPSITSLHNDYDRRQQITGNHDVFGLKWVTEAVERLTISNAAYTFVLTSYLREYAIDHGANEEDVYILPNHIDPDTFGAVPDALDMRELIGDEVRSDGELLVFVGRLETQKDPMTLLLGFELLKREHPEVSLVIVGDGSLRSDVEDYIEVKELSDVHLTGFVDRAEVAQIMGASDVFVLPTICEGLGFVFIEAHAMDLPIVTTDIPHTKIVVHEDNSLQFTPRDEVGLAEQLELALDETRREELVTQGKKALDRLSTGRQHDRAEATFHEIVEKHRAG